MHSKSHTKPAGAAIGKNFIVYSFKYKVKIVVNLYLKDQVKVSLITV